MRFRKPLAGAAMVAAVIVVTGNGAFAGEITGNGRLKEVHARSLCAFSGQNDGYHIPSEAEDEFDATQRVQSFGQIVRLVGPIGGIPGVACNPNGEGFPE